MNYTYTYGAGGQIIYTTTTTNLPYITTESRICQSINQEGNHQMSHSEPTAYEVTLKDGTKVNVADVTSYDVAGEFVRFYRNMDGYTNVLVQALRSELIFGFEPVANPEALVEPKYTYELTLKDGSTKTVKADLYRVATHGHEANQVQVYEFFTRVKVGSSQTREELTIPYESVQMVERVVEDLSAVSVPTQDAAPASA